MTTATPFLSRFGASSEKAWPQKETTNSLILLRSLRLFAAKFFIQML
jgi:hypothetical protein